MNAKSQTSIECGAPPNQAETRLLESALRLFAEKGYDGTTIREIIERAGVTRPVLYYYFENKEALFCRLVKTTFLEFSSGVDDILSTYACCRDRLKALMRMAFEHAQRSPEMVRLILQVFFSAPQEGPTSLEIAKLDEDRMKRIARVMREGVESGELAPRDPWTLALAFGGIMDTYIMAKSHEPGATLTAELADGLVDLFIEGAATNGGRLEFPFRVEADAPARAHSRQEPGPGDKTHRM